MVDFKKLKKQSNSIEKFAAAIEKESNQGFQQDERLWQPEVDKAGNGYAVIRFLPAAPADGDDALPWVKRFEHAFQGPGGWYIENSLTSIGKEDPVSEYNTKLWNSGSDANKDIARKQKRKLVYISNIYVVSDPKHPEKEGKVFIYRYGKKIFDKIKDAMNPPVGEDGKPVDPDEQPLDVFNLWDGANFKLKIRNVEGYRNYDKSEFDSPSALLGGDDKKLEAVWNSEYSLKEFLDESQFKDYGILKQKLDKVLGLDTKGGDVDLDEPTPAVNSPGVRLKRLETAETEVVEDEENLFSNLPNVD